MKIANLTITEWAAVVSIITALIGILALIWKVLVPLGKRIKRLFNSLARFAEDWFGDEEAPGKDRTPGVMERLNKIDGELKHNGGSTMKDALKRVETRVEDIAAGQGILKTNQETLKENQGIITSWMAGIDTRLGRLEKGTEND